MYIHFKDSVLDFGLSWWLSGENPPANVGDLRLQVRSLGQEGVLWRRKWQPAPMFLPGQWHHIEEP